MSVPHIAKKGKCQVNYLDVKIMKLLPEKEHLLLGLGRLMI